MRTKFHQLLNPINSCLKNSNRRGFTNKRQYASTSSSKQTLLKTDIRHEEEFLYESRYKPLPLPNENVWTFFMDNQHGWQNKPAFTCGMTGRSYTHCEIKDNSLKLSSSLQRLKTSLGVQERQLMVAAFMSNSPEWPIAFFGTLAMGGIFTPINITYSPFEAARHILDSGSDVVIVDNFMEPIIKEAQKILRKTAKDIKIISNGKSSYGHPNLQEIFNSPTYESFEPIIVDPSSPAILPYSSGTSGVPKGVIISHSAITNNISASQHQEQSNLIMANDSHQEVVMGLLPLFHIYGIGAVFLHSVASGSEVVTLPKFDPKAFITAMSKHKFTMLHTVPSLLQFVAQSPAVTKSHLSHTRTVVCGAAPVHTVFADSLRLKAENSLLFQEVYGMTETLVTHITPTKDGVLGSCGLLTPHVTSKIVDIETGESLPPGEEGELLIKTPCMMTGYHNNEEATKETIDEEGWLHTGDIATVNENGYFSIVDRLKELIKVKGSQVSPTELECFILSHPGVADVGIIGVADDRAGEVPKAFVVKRDPNLSASDVESFVAESLSRTKHLVGGVQFVDALPRNAAGKLLRRELKTLA